MTPKRPIRFAAILACLALLPAARAEDAKSVFDSLFAAKIKSVSATADRADDVALAKELLVLAKTSENQPALVALLCDAAHDISARHADGYATAAEAMTLLAETIEEKRPAARDKLITLLTRQSASGKPDEREAAGEALIDLLITIGDEKSEKKQYAEATADYRRAVAVATQKKSASLEDAKAKLEFVQSRDRTMKNLARLQEKLLKDANDSPTAEEIVKLYVVELDDPESAKAYLNRVKDVQLTTLVPLAAGPADQISAENALKLGEWYKLLADSTRGAALASLLRRADDILAKYIASDAASGVLKTKAEVLLKDVKASEQKLAVKPEPKAPPKVPAKGKETSLAIIEAKYGAGESWVDVTRDVRAMATQQYLAVMAGFEPAVRDPKPGAVKRLVVRYKTGTNEQTQEASDGEMLVLVAPDGRNRSEKLKIVEAKYGAGKAWLDLTAAMGKQATGKETPVTIDIAALSVGDPAPFRHKVFVIFYELNGKLTAKIVPEGRGVQLP